MRELLLRHRADPLLRTSAGNTPLHYAAFNNHIEAAQLILSTSIQMNLVLKFDVTLSNMRNNGGPRTENPKPNVSLCNPHFPSNSETRNPSCSHTYHFPKPETRNPITSRARADLRAAARDKCFPRLAHAVIFWFPSRAYFYFGEASSHYIRTRTHSTT